MIWIIRLGTQQMQAQWHHAWISVRRRWAPWSHTRLTQIQSDPLDSFMQMKSKIIDFLLFAKYDHRFWQPCIQCGTSEACIHCLDCTPHFMLCKNCIVAQHAHTSFHQVERWNGTHCDCTSLQSLGAVIWLDHHESPCPNAMELQKVSVIDLCDIQQANISYCDCLSWEEVVLQLIQGEFFSATMKRPGVVTTQVMLHDFLLATHSSKVTIQDYLRKIQWWTNRILPDSVLVSSVSSKPCNLNWPHNVLTRTNIESSYSSGYRDTCKSRKGAARRLRLHNIHLLPSQARWQYYVLLRHNQGSIGLQNQMNKISRLGQLIVFHSITHTILWHMLRHVRYSVQKIHYFC